jgi:glyoxylase-like metal-dependent hydrolase (beta-lactamase superfamily II)
VTVATDWFEVYRVATGVFALVESRQFQETISYLIVGERGALLFDTGLGVVPIRPVVEELTSLPVRVLNSHTHYDHVGGNVEFGDILARDTPYTRANQRGFPHEELAGEVAAESFCGAPPSALDTDVLHPSLKATRTVADGDTIDLGGRVLRVVAVPGHTPDVALLDSARGFSGRATRTTTLPSGLHSETDLDAYERSIDRLTQLAPSLTRLLPAHNVATAEPTRRRDEVGDRAVRDGKLRGTVLPPNRVEFRFDHFAILTSQPLPDGRTGIVRAEGPDSPPGSSGLWCGSAALRRPSSRWARLPHNLRLSRAVCSVVLRDGRPEAPVQLQRHVRWRPEEPPRGADCRRRISRNAARTLVHAPPAAVSSAEDLVGRGRSILARVRHRVEVQRLHLSARPRHLTQELERGPDTRIVRKATDINTGA